MYGKWRARAGDAQGEEKRTQGGRSTENVFRGRSKFHYFIYYYWYMYLILCCI
jgi:hypothetical protein